MTDIAVLVERLKNLEAEVKDLRKLEAKLVEKFDDKLDAIVEKFETFKTQFAAAQVAAASFQGKVLGLALAGSILIPFVTTLVTKALLK